MDRRGTHREPEYRPVPTPSLLTSSEVRAWLRVSRQTLRRWTASGLLTPIRIGGVLRYSADEVERLITSSAGRDVDQRNPSQAAA